MKHTIQIVTGVFLKEKIPKGSVISLGLEHPIPIEVPYLSIAIIIYDKNLDMPTATNIFLRRCISYSTFLEDVFKEESFKKTKYVSLY